MVYASLYIVSLLIPYPSVQHFIWPLHWCLLADICNHTFIPECGSENEDDIYSRRLFLDECDLYEYNCDYEADYYPINYSDCFNVPVRPSTCPPIPPCPSFPPCPDHRFHRMGQKFNFIPSRRMAPKPTTTRYSLPMHMLKGKRRYSPTGRKKKRRPTGQLTIGSTVRKTILKTAPTTRTKILKKITIKKNGQVFVKVIKAIIKKSSSKINNHDSDFLE